MNELARQKYLSAMGIDSYMPRLVLPHAPAPVLCALPEVAVPMPVQPQAEPAPVNPVSAVSSPAKETPESVSQVLADMGAKQSQKVVKKAPLPPLARAPVVSAKPLHLDTWCPSPALIVLDQHEPGTALPKETLLANILQLTRQIGSPIGSAERTRYPISDELSGYTEEQLQGELQVWLHEKLVKSPQAELWVFGLRLAQYLASEADPPEAPFTHTHITCHGKVATERTALVLPSLTELLQKPELKRELWRALQKREPH